MTRGTHAGRQTTLREQVTLSGIGIHSGSPVTLTLHPAEPDTGIVFLRCGAARSGVFYLFRYIHAGAVGIHAGAGVSRLIV